MIFFCSFFGGIIMTSTTQIVGRARGAGLRYDDDAVDHDRCVKKDWC